LGNAFYSLLGGSLENAETILASYNGTKPICDVISAMAESSLPEFHKPLENLLDRVRKVETKRNKIIHGHWQMCVTIPTVRTPHGAVFRQTGGEWRRVYKTIRATDRHQIH